MCTSLTLLTGWRVGWALSTPGLLKGLAVYHNNTSYCAPSPLQHGLAVALGVEDGSFEASAKRRRFIGYGAHLLSVWLLFWEAGQAFTG